MSIWFSKQGDFMTFDKLKLQQIVASALERAKQNRPHKRWTAAILRASEALLSGAWLITELADSYLITTESGQTYHVNGNCDCKAGALGQACKHRAAVRLIELYQASPVASRSELISSIKASWPKAWPPLGQELMARFKKNRLEMLADDMLAGVLASISNSNSKTERTNA